MEKIQIDISARFSELRQIMNLSQKKLAQMLDLSQSAISKIENGTTPSIEVMVNMCKLSSLTMEEFLGIGNSNEPLSPDMISLKKKASMLSKNTLSRIIDLIDSIIEDNK